MKTKVTAFRGKEPVSYTHLDVYKRQVQNSERVLQLRELTREREKAGVRRLGSTGEELTRERAHELVKESCRRDTTLLTIYSTHGHITVPRRL